MPPRYPSPVAASRNTMTHVNAVHVPTNLVYVVPHSHTLYQLPLTFVPLPVQPGKQDARPGCLSYTYAIDCVDNGHRYVGVSRDPRRRFQEHLRHPPQRMLADHIKYQPFTFHSSYEILGKNKIQGRGDRRRGTLHCLFRHGRPKRV